MSPHETRSYFQVESESARGVILPDDRDYNETRKVYNGMIDKHPKLIVKCANAADVRLAVAFARENDLLVAVGGGGHNGAGLATCDDGMVIDFTQMKGVRTFAPASLESCSKSRRGAEVCS